MSILGLKFNDNVGDFSVDCMQIDMMAGHFSHRRRTVKIQRCNIEFKETMPCGKCCGNVRQNDPTDSEERDQRVASPV